MFAHGDVDEARRGGRKRGGGRGVVNFGDHSTRAAACGGDSHGIIARGDARRGGGVFRSGAGVGKRTHSREGGSELRRATPVVVLAGLGGTCEELELGIVERAGNAERTERGTGGADDERLGTRGTAATDDEAEGEIIASRGDVGEYGEVDEAAGVRNGHRENGHVAGGTPSRVGDHDGVGGGIARLHTAQRKRGSRRSKNGSAVFTPLVGQRRGARRCDGESSRRASIHSLADGLRADGSGHVDGQGRGVARRVAGHVADHGSVVASVGRLHVAQGQSSARRAGDRHAVFAPLKAERCGAGGVHRKLGTATSDDRDCCGMKRDCWRCGGLNHYQKCDVTRD